MNDAEIIKALECCRNGDGVCEDCPSNNKRKNGKDCIDEIIREALALINRQQAEIEKLKKLQQRQADLIIEERGRRYELASQLTTLKAEAVREFAEKLKEQAFECDISFGLGSQRVKEAVAVDDIDNLVKEFAKDINVRANPEQQKGE